jgi:hypothetical protein
MLVACVRVPAIADSGLACTDAGPSSVSLCPPPMAEPPKPLCDQHTFHTHLTPLPHPTPPPYPNPTPPTFPFSVLSRSAGWPGPPLAEAPAPRLRRSTGSPPPPTPSAASSSPSPSHGFPTAADKTARMATAAAAAAAARRRQVRSPPPRPRPATRHISSGGRGRGLTRGRAGGGRQRLRCESWRPGGWMRRGGLHLQRQWSRRWSCTERSSRRAVLIACRDRLPLCGQWYTRAVWHFQQKAKEALQVVLDLGGGRRSMGALIEQPATGGHFITCHTGGRGRL